MKPIVGIIGGGKFGLALVKLLSENADVMLYSRRDDLTDEINETQKIRDTKLKNRIYATSDLSEVCERTQLIMPVISSQYFRTVMQEMSAHLTPKHILIHGTKGFDLLNAKSSGKSYQDFKLEDVKTMSDIILDETNVKRVGSLCGPNLAEEILNGLPAATVIASEFDEVIREGREVLAGKSFFVFGSYDLKGAEVAGALKNVVALASGILGGRSLGKNAEAILIVRGLREMIHLGEKMGATSKAFFGTAGIGDLIATCTSEKSRNYRCGMRIAQGESLEQILSSSSEVVEGIRSLEIAYNIAKKYKIHAPIIKTVYDIIHNKKDIDKTILGLMKYPLASDVDYF